MTIDLNQCRFIGKSARRECYQHPEDATKCIRVFINPHTPPDMLLQEISAYRAVQPYLHDYIPIYDDHLIRTNKGEGMVTTLLQDDGGGTSVDIHDYLLHGGDRENIMQQLGAFHAILKNNDLFFYDFNYKNFVVQVTGGQPRLKYIDLKSYRRHNAFLKLDRLSPWFARRMRERRMARLVKRLDGFVVTARR